MAYLTSILGRGIGLVEFFKNPTIGEWRELCSVADPIDGVRGYLIGDDLLVWGSLPLHGDIRSMIEANVADLDQRWIGVQINAALVTILVTETVDRDGIRPPDRGAIAAVGRSLPLLRLLGSGMIVRTIGRVPAKPVEA